MNTKISIIPANLALLLVRLIIGGIFIFSAYMKFTMWDFTVQSFVAMHIPLFITYIVAGGEMLFGICLVLGLFNSIASLFLSVVMVFAVYYSYSYGFQVYALPLATLGGTLALNAAGAGKWKIGNTQ